ncbi:MAG TPA: hypothetical protein VF018_09840, partial [Acidobacteriaceae bacterium]
MPSKTSSPGHLLDDGTGTSAEKFGVLKKSSYEGFDGNPEFGYAAAAEAPLIGRFALFNTITAMEM